jgi:UDP-2-acetamido-2,6-beta-L-arabino-hexul-4-ose reductase
MNHPWDCAAVGITGPRGFIAAHLARRLQQFLGGKQADGGMRLVACDRDTFDDPAALQTFVAQCDTIVHLAGMNRGDGEEMRRVNVGLAERLVTALQGREEPPHVVLASTTHRERPTPYGRSKREAEQRLRQWARDSGGSLTVLVIPNVFGPGCQPFYNSVVATFCHQLAHGQQPMLIDDQTCDFVWINDLVGQIVTAIGERPQGTVEKPIIATARMSVSQLLAKLEAMRDAHFYKRVVPELTDPLDAALYATFMSHVEPEDHCHRPAVHRDERGKLVEILRLAGGGQVFFSTTRPGIVRGNHFHTRKVEWFCVLAGEAAIRMRRLGDGSVREFRVTGRNPEFISIPPLYTHQIENVGVDELLTVFWCNEIYEPSDADTFVEQVA